MGKNTDSTLKYMKVKTRGNSSPQGKPRVYFTCHPKDLRYFDEICESIFKTQDCAIYYTEDMTEPLPELYRDTDLGRMNLFVMPITFRLLTEPNRAMDSDYAFADEHHIPVLPLMMEREIDEFYKKRFGERQYLSPYSHDMTEISYDEKLKKHLSAVLFDDETAERVRKAFDAYIFLSYRKKDRHHANELMRLIHKNPMYRDVAIWYDEFLTPGENFNKNIRTALNKSDLFALLVTPNLVNEQNYVQATEYPAARNSGKNILPAEMVKTDRVELEAQYEDIPTCVDAHSESELDAGILAALKELALKPNEDDPEHNFLIGLAYLEGIDVEVNKEYAVKLITTAAEKELPEAMQKLFFMYFYGVEVQLNYSEALKWAKRVVDRLNYICGKHYPSQRLTALSNLAATYSELGNHKKALELHEKIWSLRREMLGERHPDTLLSLSYIAWAYGELGNHRKELELKEKVYALRCEVLGEQHIETLKSLNNLAVAHSNCSNYQKALELHKKELLLTRETLGEKNTGVLISLNNIAFTHGKLGDYQTAVELLEKVCEQLCELDGEKSPRTLTSFSNLAYVYGKIGNHQKELELAQKVYVLRCQVLGEKHPDTLAELSGLADIYSNVGNYQKALELHNRAYAFRCEVLGENHPRTLASLNSLACTCFCLADNKKSCELFERLYALTCQVFGERHPNTIASLNNLICVYAQIGDHQKERELTEKMHTLQSEALTKNCSQKTNSYGADLAALLDELINNFDDEDEE